MNFEIHFTNIVSALKDGDVETSELKDSELGELMKQVSRAKPTSPKKGS